MLARSLGRPDCDVDPLMSHIFIRASPNAGQQADQHRNQDDQENEQAFVFMLQPVLMTMVVLDKDNASVTNQVNYSEKLKIRDV
jgi:hypothetical protein